MTDMNKEPKTIWGSVPAPTADEIETAWDQMTKRHMTDPAIAEAGPSSGANRLRLTEFSQASPALFRHLDLLSRQFADVTGDPSDVKAYRAGMADFVELLGTVAINRQVNAIEAQFPPEIPEIG